MIERQPNETNETFLKKIICLRRDFIFINFIIITDIIQAVDVLAFWIEYRENVAYRKDGIFIDLWSQSGDIDLLKFKLSLEKCVLKEQPKRKI